MRRYIHTVCAYVYHIYVHVQINTAVERERDNRLMRENTLFEFSHFFKDNKTPRLIQTYIFTLICLMITIKLLNNTYCNKHMYNIYNC